MIRRRNRADADLGVLFDRLRQEDESHTPDVAALLDRARMEAASLSSGPARPVPSAGRRVWWRAVPLGSLLAAAGLGAIALVRGPSTPEDRFQAAVQWAEAHPLFVSVGVPSDGLLEESGWTVLRTGSPLSGLGSGLGDMLRIDVIIQGERTNS